MYIKKGLQKGLKTTSVTDMKDGMYRTTMSAKSTQPRRVMSPSLG